MKNYQTYIYLTAVILLGTVLRFWHLDLKSLWLDEIITAIFSLGRNYSDIPLDVVFPIQQLPEIFTWQPGVSCSEIAENLANDSTHPPLFFCGMYGWLGWLNSWDINWVIKLRFLPALFGVTSIIAMYSVNSIAFSSKSGIMAALLMALSPFAVYLSQEARHYTLPMLLIILSLFFLIKIQQDIFLNHDSRFRFWLLWAVINSIGLYIHYFFTLSLNAEIFTLLLLIYRVREKIINFPKVCLYFILSISTIIIAFIPWVLIIFSHLRKSETNWLPSPQHVEPIYQTLLNWVLMIITLPVENQTLIIQVISGFLMVTFTLWMGYKVFKNLVSLWFNHTTHFSIFTFSSFIFFVLLQFFVIAYFLGKDITIVPRYSFVYYPSFCALFAVGLEKLKVSKYIFLSVGIISCIFVVNNLTFQKPFFPDQVARNMNLEPDIPLMLVIKYDNYQDVAGGLSFAVALENERSHNQQNQDSLAFIDNSFDLSNLDQKLANFSTPNKSQFNLWFIGSSIRRENFAPEFAITAKTMCNIDTNHYHRTGRFPYQLYRCNYR
ncbi:glycosyltransferase family 39 protein [Okeanomitos corallinicola TIOX110]|uniref:Glycosyltransferase family 39 protein n=1 Tax=Okeanomitos corallinicola TIOX110 TaxID=3133117 RepID=A0ABZ2UVA6_9CYAN